MQSWIAYHCNMLIYGEGKPTHRTHTLLDDCNPTSKEAMYGLFRSNCHPLTRNSKCTHGKTTIALRLEWFNVSKNNKTCAA